MRKFTIRSLLLLVAIVAVVIAFDSTATNRKAKFLNALEKSPTSTLKTTDRGDAACWQTVTGITDLTSITDRLMCRRKVLVRHTLHVLWNESDDEIEPRSGESSVTIGWRGSEIETGYYTGSKRWLERNSTKIPEDAIRDITM